MKYLLLIVSVLCLCACDTSEPKAAKPDGIRIKMGDKSVDVPAGHEVTLTGSDYVGSSFDKRDGVASGVGNGVETESDTVAQSVKLAPPFAWLPTTRAGGGGSDIRQSLIGATETSPLVWVGIVCLIAAGVAFYFGLRRAALICAGLGGAFVVAGMLPAWAFVVLAVAGVATVGVYVYAELKAKKSTELNRSFVWAIFDKMPVDLRNQVLPYVKGELEKNGPINDEKTLHKLRASEGIL